MRTITKIFLFFLATLSLLGGIYAVAAWQSPTAGPPANNTDAPLNIGSDFQEKTGGLKLLYLILKPGEKPADTEGAMFYDTANKIFQCFQNDKWYNCLGYILPKVKADNSGFETDILEIINPLRSDKMARLANILGPVENNDAANKEFVVNYVDDQVGGSGSGSLSDIKQSWQMYNIYITPDTHDGNFGGWPGVDKFCQDQMNNKQCIVFSSDMISASYVGGSPLNFATWDIEHSQKAYYGHRYLNKDFIHQNLSNGETVSQYYKGLSLSAVGNYNLPCDGFTNISRNALLFLASYENINSVCNVSHPVACACPSITLKRWKIMATAQTHDGNFAGQPGIDKFCADQLGQGCRVFSNDILHSAYYDGPRLNYAEWDQNINNGWFGGNFILEEDGTNINNDKKGATNLYRGGCWGWTTTLGAGFLFNRNGTLTSVNCNTKHPVICACPEN
ncbi:MAG TPA: hypothetical protein PKM84_01105 [Candidatus Pacearchaeota archaeon]|nr:hypothetical protein [Candidatus Pacearchaeota archaeon]